MAMNSRSPVELTRACAALFMMGLLFIFLAAFYLRRSACEAGAYPKSRVARKRPHFARFGSINRSALLMNPMQWLAERNKSVPTQVAFCLSAMVIGVAGRIAFTQGWRFGQQILPLAAYLLNALFKVLVVTESCRQINQDKRSGALELLLSTSLPSRFIIRGVLCSVRNQFLAPAVAIVLMDVIWMTCVPAFIKDLRAIFPMSIVLLFADSYALAWRGLANAARGHRYPATVFHSYIQVMGLPLGFFIILSTFPGNISWWRAWTVGTVIYDFALVKISRDFLQNFRQIAAGDLHRVRRRSSAQSPEHRISPKVI
jgi:hypothetical protein